MKIIYIHSFIFFIEKYIILFMNTHNAHAQLTCLAQVIRALHQYRRGHGFESRTSLNFFQASFLQLFNYKLHKYICNCDDLL